MLLEITTDLGKEMLIEMPSLLGKKWLVDMSTFEGLAEKKNVLFGMFSLQDFHFLQEKHLNEII